MENKKYSADQWRKEKEEKKLKQQREYYERNKEVLAQKARERMRLLRSKKKNATVAAVKTRTSAQKADDKRANRERNAASATKKKVLKQREKEREEKKRQQTRERVRKLRQNRKESSFAQPKPEVNITTPAFSSRMGIKVYRVYGGGQYVGDEAAEWFSSYLKRPGCKLYKLSQPKLICEDEKWGDVALPGDKASFGNFSPFMITTEQSLVALNGVLPSPVTMERFRPNVVVDGLKAYDEDKWTKKIIKIGDVEFRFLKNCGRCSLTTVNPATGEKEGNEPLATLQRIRLPEDRDPRQGQAPLFGVQFALDGDRIGVVRIGDIVMVSA